MTELSIDDPCVLFAVRRESGAFCREFRPQQRFPGAPCRARFCGPEWLSVLVMETGIGRERATEAVSWLLARPALEQVPYRPKVVIAAGFAGALQENRAVGDVVLATEIIDAEGRNWPTTWPGELPPGEWQPPLHRGRLLSMPRLIGSSDEKRALGREHQALAVDMESAAIAEHCRRHEVPFGCVRAISDCLDTPLSPKLLTVLSGSEISPVKLAGALVKSPALARELWRLTKATRQAAIQLQRALGELLTLTLPWGKDL